MKNLPATIREMLNSPQWDGFIHDKLGNDLFLSDPERADRIHEAAKDGGDGSTHAEHIEDWLDFVDILHSEAMSECENEQQETSVEDWYVKILSEIEACEKWHEQNDSLNKVVG